MAVIIQTESGPYPKYQTFDQRYISLFISIAALGGVLFGFDLVIISGTVSFFSRHFSLNEFQTGWAVGCLNLGAALGALVGGRYADRLGRKKLLLFSAALFALTGVGTGWANTFYTFVAFRMMSGVAVGIAALVCPMYVAEVSPAPVRGKIVSFYQLSIVIGILLAYLSNYLLLKTGENNWRWMFSSQAVPALLFFVGLFWVPESPRWLVGKQRRSEAYALLTRIGGAKHADLEIEQIEQSFLQHHPNRVRDLFRKDIVHVLVLGIVIAVFSQAVGQNSLFSYAPVLFQQAGIAQDTAFMQSIIIGLITFVFTFIAIRTIDRVGRKKLLLYGSALLGIDALALAFAFYWHLSGGWVLFFVLAFIAVYSATLGPVTWVALSEIFPNRIRAKALAVSTLALWVANFFTTSLFPVMNTQLGPSVTFAVHAGLCFIYMLFVWIRVPETKGKTLEEIELLLQRQTT
ncbi:sugar porter family MFS transporter [Spirosoma areae]